jgi:hypothetical protein
MSVFDLNTLDLIGALLGFLLTIFILSYIWGDNVLFRIATHLFVGVAAGYVTIVVIQNVIFPQLFWPILEGDRSEKIFAILFLILGVLMLTKISPRLNALGNPAIAYLVGVGAAAAIGGAVIGSIFPQVSKSIDVFFEINLFDALWIFVGTLSTLLYFQFGIRRKNNDDEEPQRPIWIDTISKIGQFFIAVTFGALFSGVYLAAITALIERASFIWDLIRNIFLA